MRNRLGTVLQLTLGTVSVGLVGWLIGSSFQTARSRQSAISPSIDTLWADRPVESLCEKYERQAVGLSVGTLFPSIELRSLPDDMPISSDSVVREGGVWILLSPVCDHCFGSSLLIDSVVQERSYAGQPVSLIADSPYGAVEFFDLFRNAGGKLTVMCDVQSRLRVRHNLSGNLVVFWLNRQGVLQSLKVLIEPDRPLLKGLLESKPASDQRA